MSFYLSEFPKNYQNDLKLDIEFRGNIVNDNAHFIFAHFNLVIQKRIFSYFGVY